MLVDSTTSVGVCYPVEEHLFDVVCGFFLPATTRNSVSSDEVTTPENKHKSPLSKLSVISRISMKNKKVSKLELRENLT